MGRYYPGVNEKYPIINTIQYPTRKKEAQHEASSKCSGCGWVVVLRYEVALKGQASKLDFHLDKTELDFGEVPYTEALRSSCW